MDVKYWAAEAPEKIAGEIMNKVEAFKEYVEKQGILGELRKSHTKYYGQVNIQDVDQSLKAIHVNHYANLIRHGHVMVTSTRPAWATRAANTDSESQADTMLADGLLEYYMREKRLENHLNRSAELALFLKEGWITLDWDVTGGEIYGKNPDNGQPIYEGDVLYQTHNLLEVIRDCNRRDMNHEWFIVKTYENKWNLAAKYPELAEKIQGLTIEAGDVIKYDLAPEVATDKRSTDIIPVYTLRHAKTEALPQGRMTIVLADDIKLFDGPLPYRSPYVFPMISGKKENSPFGHSPMMDGLPVQDAFDMCVSAILTNQAANAVQNFQCPKGAAPRVTKIMDGMNVWEYDPKAGKIEPMDILKTAPEVFNFASFLKTQMEELMNVPPITKGIAPPSMSGTAMALLQQQALQAASGLQQSRNIVSEQVGTATLELLQTFAVVPRIAMIAGKSKRSFMKSFKGEDIKFGRVFVDDANPLTKTGAGRIEIANQLLATPNMIKTPEQYIGVLTTGNLEPLYEHESGQLYLMRSENEWLMDGKPVQAILTDDHPLHVLEHSTVLNSPEARQDPRVVQATLAHIQEHINIAKNMDPATAAMLKQASFAAPPQPQGPPPGPQHGPGPLMNPENPITQQAMNTKLPKPAEPPQLQQ